MKKFTMMCLIGLVGCTSPIADMSPAQVAQLTDDQLCGYRNYYPYDQNTELEIGRRNLNCDPATRSCMKRGLNEGSPELNLCVTELRNKWALESQLANQAKENERLRNQALLNRNTANQSKFVVYPDGRVIKY